MMLGGAVLGGGWWLFPVSAGPEGPESGALAVALPSLPVV